jgi:hypothetical protein
MVLNPRAFRPQSGFDISETIPGPFFRGIPQGTGFTSPAKPIKLYFPPCFAVRVQRLNIKSCKKKQS